VRHGGIWCCCQDSSILVTFLLNRVWQKPVTNTSFVIDVLRYVVQMLLCLDDVNRDECGDDVEEDVRLSEMAQILENYQSSNIVTLMSTELYDGQPRNTLEYSHCCTALQSKLLYKYRHFLYITGISNNIDNVQDNVYDNVIITKTLHEFTHFS